MDASLRTFVVSWNEAADIKLSVPKDALVIPCKEGLETAASAFLTSTIFLSFLLSDEFSSLNSLEVMI